MNFSMSSLNCAKHYAENMTLLRFSLEPRHYVSECPSCQGKVHEHRYNSEDKPIVVLMCCDNCGAVAFFIGSNEGWLGTSLYEQRSESESQASQSVHDGA